MTTQCGSRWITLMRTTVVTMFVATSLAGSLLAQTAQERLAASVTENLEQMQVTHTDLQNTVGALEELRNQSGDLRPTYEKFSDSIEKTRNSSGLAAKLFGVMSADSETYFEEWRAEIDAISNPQIKKASSKRLSSVEKQYEKLLEELEPIPPLFNPLMSDLDDFKNALGMDLTPAGLEALSKAMNKTNKSLSAFQAPITGALEEFDKLASDLAPAAPPTQ
jgi:hypothetical protein